MKLQNVCNDAFPLLKMWMFAKKAKVLPKDPNLAFCYDILNKVSRSFAIVIQQLPPDLKDSVCIFYLVLRALDTVEDDMSIPIKEKVPALRAFHKYIYDRSWSMKCGTNHYARLMEKYPSVTSIFLRLPKAHQQVIEDIAKRMGEGMAEFIEREVTTVEDYDKYCYYVAGLVGVGLSQLFAVSGHESEEFRNMEKLSISMGLFLQKTNIIRDYLEDINEEPAPRMFWPRQVWGKYGNSLEEFKNPENAQNAVQALNELVTDALRHGQDSLEYMSKLRNEEIFRFCAIPQVMAIATLSEIYNNHKVFTGVVKVRRGIVAQYLVGTQNQHDLERAFLRFSKQITKRSKGEAANDPNARLTQERAEKIGESCTKNLQKAKQPLVKGQNKSLLIFRLSILLLGVYLVFQAILTGESNSLTILQSTLLLPLILIAALFIYSSSQRV